MKYKVFCNSNFAKLVNNNDKLGTLNEFLTFKESFSPRLFDELSNLYNFKNIKKIYDPFVGTGSIFLNKKVSCCYGEDVNPLSVEITKVKNIPIDLEESQTIINTIKSRKVKIKSYEFPIWKSFDKYVDKKRYDFVKSYIESFKGNKCYNFIKMVIICNLDKIFNFKHDGNGIKFRLSKISEYELREFLDNLVIKSLQCKIDFQMSNPDKSVKIFNKSSVIFNNEITDIDVIITSPPYCNMFDYFEVYKIELWTAGIVNTYEEMKNLKKKALRSNFNTAINNDYVESSILKNCIKNLQKNSCSSKKIKMIKNYFYDMNEVIKNCCKYLKSNGLMFIVVGNSFYNFQPVITDEILAELAEKNGFAVEGIITARKLSTSSQQMKHINNDNKIYLRESIVALRRL